MMQKNLGFTLLELTVSMTILAILATLALPSYQQYGAAQESKKTTQLFISYIQQAKTEAVLRRQNVVICATNNEQVCSLDWSYGYLVFIDLNKNRTFDANEEVLSQVKFNLKYGNLSWKAFNKHNRIIFEGFQGLPIASNGTLSYCSHQYNFHQNVVLSRLGQARQESTASCTSSLN